MELSNKLTPEHIEAKIDTEEYGLIEGKLTFCILKLTNGFMVTGESCPIDIANFDPIVGQKLAKEKAMDKLWMLEGYLRAEQLHAIKTMRAHNQAVEFANARSKLGL